MSTFDVLPVCKFSNESIREETYKITAYSKIIICRRFVPFIYLYDFILTS